MGGAALAVSADSSALELEQRALAGSDDQVHDVVQRIVEKSSAGVGSYVRWGGVHADKTLLDWIRIVSKNAIRDCLRARLGPRPATEQPSVKRLLNEFACSEQLAEFGHRPPFTAVETARELYEFAQQHLSAPQLAMFSLWLEGQSFDDIAAAADVPREPAAPLLHAGIAVLRRNSREKGHGDASGGH
jgi:DNA-directed RNA polymerase specialized sigma24 family protein